MLDCDQIVKNLWVGAHPLRAEDLLEDGPVDFDLLVLCAEEAQAVWGLAAHQGKKPTVMQLPMREDPSRADLERALEVSLPIFLQLTAGKRVLITCASGINRSALVAGLVLMRQGTSAREAIKLLQFRRKHALSNDFLGEYLRQVEASGALK